MTVTLPRRAYLGAELPGDHEAFTADGVRIASVYEGGMAARAGIVAGDVLVALAGMPIGDACALAAALRRAGGEATTQVIYIRDGERHEANVAVDHVACETDARYEELAGLRLIATPGTRATILMIGGIACESIEAFAPLAAAWTRAGFATVRFDKRGVGDSAGGPCRDVDFAAELADARAVAAHVVPDVIFGHSVGAIIATQLPPARGIIVYGAPATKWIECLLASTRRQLELRGAPIDDIARSLIAIRELATTGELNGRSAAYHAQLDAIDVPAAWHAVAVPVLACRGGFDWVVDDDIPRAERLDIPELDHMLGHHADLAASFADYGAAPIDDRVALATLPWLDRLLSSP